MNESARTAILVDGTAAGTLAVSYLTRASAYDGPELCLVRRILHVRCAGCGLMRSFASLWDGNVAEAFRMHGFGPILFLALVLAPVVDLTARALDRAPIVPRLLSLRASQLGVALAVIASLAFPMQDSR